MEERMSLGRSWLVAVSAILMAIACAISMFTVPATMPLIIADWGLDVAQASWLMTIVAVVSTVLALPGGMIVDKLGARKTAFIVMAIAIAGDVIGALTSSFAVMLVGRAMQGIAYGLVNVFITAIISKWFPPERRGLPMAIQTLYVAIGMTCILNAANGVTPMFGWQGNWWLAAILLAVTLVFYILVGGEKNLPEFGSAARSQAGERPKNNIVEGLKSPGAWLLLIVMIGFGFGQSAFTTFFPTYLTTELSFDMAAANSAASIASIVNIVIGICVGVILNVLKPKHHSIYLVVAMVLVVICFVVQFNATPETVTPIALYAGVALQVVPAAVFTIAPTTAKSPASVGTVLGVISIGVNLCAVFGTAFVGYFVNATGSYSSCTVPLTALAVVGLLAAVGLAIVMRKKYAREEEEAKTRV